MHKKLRRTADDARTAAKAPSRKYAGVASCPALPSRRSALLDIAIAACLLASRDGTAQQSAATSGANAAAGSGQLEEVVVTAQRRTENLQDVPIAMQVLTDETLRQLSVDNFDDVVKYLPN